MKESSSIPFLLPSALRMTIPSFLTGVSPESNHWRMLGERVSVHTLASSALVILHLSMFLSQSAGTYIQSPSLTTPMCTKTSLEYPCKADLLVALKVKVRGWSASGASGVQLNPSGVTYGLAACVMLIDLLTVPALMMTVAVRASSVPFCATEILIVLFPAFPLVGLTRHQSDVFASFKEAAQVFPASKLTVCVEEPSVKLRP